MTEHIFPQPVTATMHNGGTEYTGLVSRGGLSKRELFAAMAMQGLFSSGDLETTHDVHEVASYAVKQADALLAELAKKPE